MAIIIFKQVLPLVLAALLLAVSLEATDAATKGIRGSMKQLDSIATSSTTSTKSNNNNNLSRRELKKDRKKKCKDGKKDDPKGCENSSMSNGSAPAPAPSSTSNGNSSNGSLPTVDGRFDIPADTAPAPAPTGPKLTNWMQACLTENRDVNSCSSDTSSYVCKSCLYALSLTSTTPSNAYGGVAACARDDYCGDCTVNHLMPFFTCGWEVSHPNAIAADASDADAADDAADDSFPNSSIRTPPPVDATVATATTPPIDVGRLYDLVNCPSVYPDSGTECVMIEGFEYKKCMYHELGPDVMCQCSKVQPIWSCTGTNVSKEIVVVTEDLEVTIEEEIEVDMVSPDNNSTEIEDAVFSRIEGSDESGSGVYPVSLLCPISTPRTGDRCSTGGNYDKVTCCYEDPEPSPDSLGTVTCTCSDGDRFAGFQCNTGSLSTCTV